MAKRKLEVVIVGDASSLNRALGQANAATGGFGKSLTASAKSAVKLAATTAGIVGLGAAFVKVGRETIGFDRGMRNVNSIAQLSEGQLQQLSKSVLGLAGKTAQAPGVLAEGLYDLVSSGFDARESLSILRASAKAATAGLTTTEVSTKAVAAVLNAYRMPASKASQVSDLLFRTVDRGVISFESLAENIGDVLPFASSLGVGLDEVGAAIATMTKAGISAPETMTRIKSVMQAFLKPSAGMKSALEEVGAESGEALIKEKGLQGALETLTKTTGGSKEEMAKLFPNVRALGGALALTGKNAKGARQDLAGMRDASGATDKALKQQSKSISFQWNRIKAIVSSLSIQLGSKLVPAVGAALRALAGFIGQMREGTGAGGAFASAISTAFNLIKTAVGAVVGVVGAFFKGLRDDHPAALALAGAIGGLIVAFAGLKVVAGVTAALGAMTKALAVAKVAMLALRAPMVAIGLLAAANPFVLIATALIGLGAAFVVAYRKSETFRNVVHGAINAVVSVVRTAAAVLGPPLKAAFELWLSVAKRVMSAIGQVISGAFRVIRGIVKVFAGVFSGDFGKAWDGVKDIFKGGVKTILGILRAATAPFREIASRIGEGISGAIGGAFRAVRSVARSVIDFALGMLDKFLGALQKVLEAAGKMPGPMGAPFRAAARAIKGAREGVRGLRDDLNGVERKANLSAGAIKAIAREATGIPNIPLLGDLQSLRPGRRRRKGGLAGFATGGLVPILGSPGELLVGPDGSAGIIPGRRVAADNTLLAVPSGTAVFTGHGQALLAAGASMAEALRHQLPHFARGGRVGLYSKPGQEFYRGKVSVFGPPLEGARRTASGVSSSEPGIATRNRATLGKRFVVRIGGHGAVLKQTDLGPAAWTGRAIDVTGAGARKMGFDPRRFPTDKIGTARLVGKGDQVTEEKGGRVPGLRALGRGEIDRRRMLSPLLDDAFTRGMELGREGARDISPIFEELFDAMRIPVKRLSAPGLREGRDSGGGRGSFRPGGGWAGTQNLVMQAIAGMPGRKTYKRPPGRATPQSDHNTNNRNAFAVDLSPGSDSIFQRIAGRLNIPARKGSWNKFGNRPLKGFRSQLLWHAPDGTHRDHIHLGIRRMFRGGVVGRGGRFRGGGLVDRALSLGRLGSGDNSGGTRALKALVEAITDAEVATFGRLDRIAKAIKDQIRRHMKGGLSSRERAQVERLRAALTAVTAEMGRRTGQLLQQAEKMQAAIESNRTAFEQNARIVGLDLQSLEGLGHGIAFTIGEGMGLDALKRTLVAAKRRAQRAGNREAIREIQDQINEVDAAVRERIGDIAEMAREAARQAAANFRAGLERQIDARLQSQLAAIQNSPQARELRGLLATQDKLRRAREDRDQEKALAEARKALEPAAARLERAKASGNARFIEVAKRDYDELKARVIEAEDAIADTARQRRIDLLTQQIQDRETAANREAEVARASLDQQELDYFNSLDRQLSMLATNLAARKITYEQFAAAVNRILGPLGVEFPNAPGTAPEKAHKGVSWAVWRRWTEAQRKRYRERHRHEWDEYRPRQHGGRVQPGTGYLVGEAGPEPFFPDRPGFVMSHRAAERALSGAGRGDVHLNVNGPVTLRKPQDARRELNKLAWKLSTAKAPA